MEEKKVVETIDFSSFKDWAKAHKKEVIIFSAKAALLTGAAIAFYKLGYKNCDANMAEKILSAENAGFKRGMGHVLDKIVNAGEKGANFFKVMDCGNKKKYNFVATLVDAGACACKGH